MKLDLKKIYLIVSIAFMVIVVSSETVVHAKMRRLISSMAVSDNLLFIGEMGGRIEIFDMNKLDVVARPSIAHSPQLFNDNGRILAITSWGFDLRTAIFEITPDGGVKKIGIIPGRFRGLDRQYFYCSRYVQEGSTGHYENFRVDKDLQKSQNGHIPGHPNLVVSAQTEDVDNFYFFCTLTKEIYGTKRGFALVIKNKMTDQIEVSRFAQELEWTAGPQDKEWINAEMTCDQDSIWLLLFSKKNRLVHYSKQKKKLTVTPYMSGSFLIRNSNEAELPPWTYVEHKSNQIFPMSHDAVETRKTVNATILLLKSGKKEVYTEINGFWAPEVEFDYKKRTYGIPSNIQHVLSKYPTYSRASLTYDKNLWLVAYSRDDDGSIYNLIKIPMMSGNPEVCKIRPTFGDKVNYSIAGIKDAFELLGMLIFGH